MDVISRVEDVLREVATSIDGTKREAARLIRRIDNEHRGHVTKSVGRSREREIVGLVNAGGWTVKEFVKRKLPLLELPEDLKGLVKRGMLAPTKALELRKIADPELRKTRAYEVIQRRTSVRELRGDLTPNVAPASSQLAELDWIALEVARALGLRVRLSPGEIRIEYGDGDQLAGLLERLGVEL